jgi:glycogen debranching enzyme
MGAVGCHGEVSSAEKLESKGCLNQAWSSAMYIELLTIDM